MPQLPTSRAVSAVEQELRDYLAALSPDQQREVLDYARALSKAPRRRVPGRALLRFAGSIPADDLRTMIDAIEDGCENVDP